MLQRLGARILSSVGSTCTHVVYKNGLTSTVNKWRKLKNKPHVVGIAWVVECAERKEKADETPHLIDLEGVNVAGVVKRRRSMLPRFIARELEEENSQQNGDKDDAEKSSSSKCCLLPCVQNFLSTHVQPSSWKMTYRHWRSFDGGQWAS
ncbi:hypothetical protein PLEOSDRAFT_1056143 [Pleurotus ostreatus PC15]|uniref:BRCT domain-containing protein n=1 Tax=Pleurotus ostreatus (strain PC15) TaxID=1137138 RepID=A0A067NU36_PLEO1|nr:hypothetical protein PLEOSDRAFT_1056143 [Pleurotus ostreatus PC15]